MDSDRKHSKFNASNSNSSIADVGTLSANMFLTVSDGESKNSQEFLTIECNDVEMVKQEQNVIYDPAPVVPVEYRLVNQLQPRLNTSVKTLANVFPATMQLPSGCEIYLINEYVDTFENDADSSIISTDSKKPFCEEDDKTNQLLQTKVPCWTSSSDRTAAGPVVQCQNEVNGENTKRSYLLDAYKKRDDKRRATHNEVERRRRDKINSWIFKLKELLPKDAECELSAKGAKATHSAKMKQSNCEANCNSVLVPKKIGVNQQSHQHSANNQNRTPQVESKSQILIKACEYIKSMQEEVNSLRKCLTENECLRLNNQRLQSELSKLRSERRTSLLNIDPSTESLQDYSNDKSSFSTSITPVSSTKIIANRAVFSPYIKREFIIRDYAD